MSGLADLRADVAAALTTAGLPASTVMPNRVNPPLTLVLPGSPYLAHPETANTFDPEFDVTLSVLHVTGRGTNAKALDDLDAVIETIVTTLGDWRIGEVTEPYYTNLNAGQQHLAVAMSLTHEITIGEQ